MFVFKIDQSRSAAVMGRVMLGNNKYVPVALIYPNRPNFKSTMGQWQVLLNDGLRAPQCLTHKLVLSIFYIF